ncbi:MAG: hypothetical protein VXZ18_05310, partial [Pseudomonadota bacterium]|nr:hypothetical protein [Pseudomonadota bacterium]
MSRSDHRASSGKHASGQASVISVPMLFATAPGLLMIGLWFGGQATLVAAALALPFLSTMAPAAEPTICNTRINGKDVILGYDREEAGMV